MSDVSSKLVELLPEEIEHFLGEVPRLWLQGLEIKKLCRLLIDFDFIDAKINHPKFGIKSLIEDYEFINDSELLNIIKADSKKIRILKLIQGALQLSSHILEQEPTQIVEQLWGRLQSFEIPEIQNLLALSKQRKKIFLCPLEASLDIPNEQLKYIFGGYKAYINFVVVTPDGKQLISGSADGIIKVWNLQTGIELFTLKGHTQAVTGLTVTPNNKLLVSASLDKTLKIWELKTGQELFTCKGHTKKIMTVSVTPDGKWAISGSQDKTLKIWDLKTGQELFTLKGHLAPVLAIAVTPDSKRVISGSGVNFADSFRNLNSIKVWDLETKQELFTMKGFVNTVSTLVVTPDGKQLISGSAGGGEEPSDLFKLFVWNLETGEKIRTIGSHNLPLIKALAVTPDGTRLLSSSFNETVIRVWDINTGKQLFFMSHDIQVNSIAITPDGKRFISAGRSKIITVWDLETRKIIEHTSAFDTKSPLLNKSFLDILFSSINENIKYFARGSKAEIVFTPDGKNVIFNSWGNSLKLWNLKKRREVQLIDKSVFISALAVTPNGKTLIYGLNLDIKHETLKLFDLKKGKQINHLKMHELASKVLTVTPDGKQLISLSALMTLRKWDLNTGNLNECVHLSLPRYYIYISNYLGIFSFSILGMVLGIVYNLIISAFTEVNYGYLSVFTLSFLISSIAGLYIIKKVNSQEESSSFILRFIKILKMCVLEKRVILNITITPDKKQGIFALNNGKIEVWNLNNHENTFILTGHSDEVTAVIITPDSKKLISGSTDKTIKVWNLETGIELFTLKNHNDGITTLAVSPDSKYLFSGSLDNTFKVWDLESQKVIASFATDNELRACAVAPDGRTIVAGEASGRLHFLQLQGI
jgi:WD40 repeat protein